MSGAHERQRTGSQDLLRHINWNERVCTTSAGVHVKHENPLAPRGVNNDFECRNAVFHAVPYDRNAYRNA